MRLAFWAIMLALPVLFFVLLEGGLRVAGYGNDYPAFVPIEGSPEFRMQSRDVSRRYFHNTADAPTALHDVFHTEKRPDELRLFVQGGSTAAGFPFYHGGAFSRMLEARLQQAMPHRPVEVINTAMAAVNSYTLLDLQREILAERPDAILIYAGHNEYYGALGVGSTERVGASRALVNTYLRLRHFRTVQLVRDGLGRAAGLVAGRTSGERPTGSLMARMVGRQEIRYGSRDFERGLDQFRGNLSDLLAGYRRAGVPVFVSTLVYNERDHAPFHTVLAADTDRASRQAALDRAEAALASGESARAEAAFREALALDEGAADAWFGLGRALEATGDTLAARDAFRGASDRDALRFRAPNAINDVIREVAARHGATVVDAEARFRADAPGGTIGSELMLEHLHPTVDGYFLLADAFYEALAADPLLDGHLRDPVPASVARGRVRLTPADSLVGILRVRQLMSGWPFAEPDAPRPRLEAIFPEHDTPEGRMALAFFRSEKQWLEGSEELATELERAGRIEAAARTREAMVQAYPMLPQPYLGLAGLRQRAGELDEAVRLYRLAIANGETSGNAHGMLGAIALSRGLGAFDAGDRLTGVSLVEQAREHLETARRQNPRNPQTLYNLGGAYAQLQRFDEARTAARQALQLRPDYTPAQALLASLPPEGERPD